MKRRIGKVRLVEVLALFAGLILAISLGTTPAAGQDSASGPDVFKAKCITCHGADGAGTAVGKSLKVADLRSAAVQSKSDAELTQIVSDGKDNMPGFKGTISDDEIHAVVTYVRTLAKPEAAPKKK